MAMQRSMQICAQLLRPIAVLMTLPLCRFWANMYLAQFYDDSLSASRHPSIAIDSGFMAVTQGITTHYPVGDTGRVVL